MKLNIFKNSNVFIFQWGKWHKFYRRDIKCTYNVKEKFKFKFNITHDVTNECYHHFFQVKHIFYSSAESLRVTTPSMHPYKIYQKEDWSTKMLSLELIINWQAVCHTLVGMASRWGCFWMDDKSMDTKHLIIPTTHTRTTYSVKETIISSSCLLCI